ncbi:MAG: hypothetical protein ABIF88_02730 [archaeon]
METQKQTKTRKEQKIDKKRLLLKATEDGLKKAIELVIIGIVIGLSIKLIVITIGSVMFGSVVAKTFKLNLLKGGFM